jgi:hypothetical protein
MVHDNNSGSHSAGRSSGRDNGRSSNRGSNKGNDDADPGTASSKLATAELKFNLQSTGKPQATYATIVDEITTFIQTTYTDGVKVAQSLRDLQIFVINTPNYTINVDPKLQGIDDIIYKSYMDHYIAQSALFQSNMGMAYSLIRSKYCSKALLNRVDEEIEIDPTIRDDPIKLLSTIRVLMQESVRAQYPYVTFVDTLITCLTVKQLENESLTDYSKRFKQHKGILKQMMGTEFMDYWVGNQPAYKKLTGSNAETMAKCGKIKDAAFSDLTSYLFIKGADPSKYGSLLDVFTTQFSLGSDQWNDQWPKTIEASMKVLSAHKFDPGWQEVKRRDKRTSIRDPKESKDSKSNSFAQTSNDKHKVICNCCGKPGHISPECPEKDSIAPDKWFKPKGKKSFNQTHNDTDAEQSEIEPDSEDEEPLPPKRSGRGKRGSKTSSQSRKHSDDDDGWAQQKPGFFQLEAEVQGMVLKQQPYTGTYYLTTSFLTPAPP